MKLYKSEEVLVIVKSFERFFHTLNKLIEHIETLNFPFVIQKGDRFVRDKHLLFYALKHMSSEKELSTIQTYARPGAVAGNLKTLNLVDKLNQAKDEFKIIVRDYNKRHGLVHSDQVRTMLLKAGYGVVRLNEVYRHFVAIDYHPQYLSWCKGKRYASKRVTAQEAREKLLKLGESRGITLQLNKLNTLRKKEQFVIRRESPPCWFANVKIPALKGSGSIQCYRSSLPIFYLQDKYLPEPAVVFSKPKTQVTTRSDKVTLDKPFLPSIHAYQLR